MIVEVDPSSSVPPYEQVRAGIAGRIDDGSLPVGTRLPPVRTLATDLGLAANTVARAYRELEEAGLVETAGRRGTLVAASGDAVRRRAAAATDSAYAAAAAAAYAESVAALGVGDDEAVALVRAAVHARRLAH
ncbi:GntR family transcriptional regulator [Kineosporia sp. R_H_3]|uniref:GntR family transcriptional regulator n=1 Tax=Kineosporia sp. R_H_3 TaxID=1961848 RepID=UPI000B4B46A6|nr:GntR family transcriptional regulator [Kineosporia sp. R_H_3]